MSDNLEDLPVGTRIRYRIWEGGRFGVHEGVIAGGGVEAIGDAATGFEDSGVDTFIPFSEIHDHEVIGVIGEEHMARNLNAISVDVKKVAESVADYLGDVGEVNDLIKSLYEEMQISNTITLEARDVKKLLRYIRNLKEAIKKMETENNSDKW